MIDSQIYGGAWSTDEMRAIFDDEPRTQGWLDVIAALAEAQAEVGLIPRRSCAGNSAGLPGGVAEYGGAAARLSGDRALDSGPYPRAKKAML